MAVESVARMADLNRWTTRVGETPMKRNVNNVLKIQLNFVVTRGIQESIERLLQLGFEVSNNRYDFVNSFFIH